MDKALNDFHLKTAKECFNKTWDLIDLKERSDEDITNMIHYAHASRYHWGIVGEPINFQRGEWQIARVYSLLEMGESALFHAKKCLELTEIHNFIDYDKTFAYEAMARAYSVSGDEVNKEKYLHLANESLVDIKNKEDKDYLISELSTI